MTEQEKLEDEMVVQALQNVGVHVRTTQDLMHTRDPYPAAIGTLVDMLGKVRTYMLKEIIARSLATKEAKGKTENALIAEFTASLDDGAVEARAFRWAIANTLEVIGGKGDVEAFLRLLRDPRSGSARGMLSLAAAKTRDRRLIPLLLENLETDDFLGFAARGLGILRAEEAVPKLKELAEKTKNSWVRREALTALRRMGVDTEGVVPATTRKKPAKVKSGRAEGEAKRRGKKVNEVSDSGPLAEQLRALAECGIRLSAAIGAEGFSSRFSPQGSEKDSYRLLLCALGEEIETVSESDEYLGYFSDNIWHFDTECIEGDGSYVAIAERMSTLAQGDLPLQKVDDHVDFEEGVAWLSFALDGQPHKWTLKIDDDWVDPALFDRFAELLASRKSGKRFTYINLGGQDCLIGCATPEQRACLAARTGLKVEWLHDEY